MPVLSFAHSKYWRQRGNVVVPPAPSFGGYPRWQASILHVASLLGGLQVFWDRLVMAWQWVRLTWGVPVDPDALSCVGLTGDQRRAIHEAIRVLQLDAWTTAQAAVFDTSRAEKFNEHQEWAKLGNALRDSRGLAENAWRHLRVIHALRETGLGNPEKHLLAELAYHEFAASGRGKPPRMA